GGVEVVEAEDVDPPSGGRVEGSGVEHLQCHAESPDGVRLELRPAALVRELVALAELGGKPHEGVAECRGEDPGGPPQGLVVDVTGERDRDSRRHDEAVLGETERLGADTDPEDLGDDVPRDRPGLALREEEADSLVLHGGVLSIGSALTGSYA